MPVMSDEKKVTTTDAGIPATRDEFSLTAGEQGPIALPDQTRELRSVGDDGTPRAAGRTACSR